MNRIEKTFRGLKAQNRKALIPFITAGDPDRETSQRILNALPQYGADLIEIGMPFTDPMADGPAIQMASRRALDAGASMAQTLEMVKSFRVTDTKTPVILMGYFNPVYVYGTDRFVEKAKDCGVDGLIIVDLPPEEDYELSDPVHDAGLDLIRLITPTTNEARLETVLNGASGFLYYVSITGVTGTASADMEQVGPHIAMIRQKTDLPVAIGFGIKTPRDVAMMAKIADASVVGSAIVNIIAQVHDGSATVQDVLSCVKSLSAPLETQAQNRTA